MVPQERKIKLQEQLSDVLQLPATDNGIFAG